MLFYVKAAFLAFTNTAFLRDGRQWSGGQKLIQLPANLLLKYI